MYGNILLRSFVLQLLGGQTKFVRKNDFFCVTLVAYFRAVNVNRPLNSGIMALLQTVSKYR